MLNAGWILVMKDKKTSLDPEQNHIRIYAVGTSHKDVTTRIIASEDNLS